jgi:hypothetical protein
MNLVQFDNYCISNYYYSDADDGGSYSDDDSNSDDKWLIKSMGCIQSAQNIFFVSYCSSNVGVLLNICGQK